MSTETLVAKPLLVLGIDPGFASIGFALVRLFPEEEQIIELGLIKTSKSDKKRKVLASDDNFRRATEIGEELLDMVERYPSISVLCVESMSFPRNASVAGKMSLCWGVIAMLSAMKRLPIVTGSPSEIKLATCGNKSASKEEVREALRNRYKNNAALDAMEENVPGGQLEHPYDALGAVVTGLDSEVIRMARRMVV